MSACAYVRASLSRRWDNGKAKGSADGWCGEASTHNIVDAVAPFAETGRTVQPSIRRKLLRLPHSSAENGIRRQRVSL